MRYPQHVSRDDRLLSYLHGDEHVFAERNINCRRKHGAIFPCYEIFAVFYLDVRKCGQCAIDERAIAGLAEVQEYPSATLGLPRVQQLPSFIFPVRSWEPKYKDIIVFFCSCPPW